VCALYDVGRHDGVDYLVTELLEGETLAVGSTYRVGRNDALGRDDARVQVGAHREAAGLDADELQPVGARNRSGLLGGRSRSLRDAEQRRDHQESSLRVMAVIVLSIPRRSGLAVAEMRDIRRTRYSIRRLLAELFPGRDHPAPSRRRDST